MRNPFSLFHDFFRSLPERVQADIRRIMIFAQLCAIYFMAMVVLTVSTKRMLGYFPPELQALWPFAKSIINNKLLSGLGRAETIIYFYFIAFQFIILRPLLNLSTLVKFNILLVIFLQFIYNLVIWWWDVIFMFEDGFFIPAVASSNFIVALFYFYYGAFLYCFIFAINNKVPPLPGILKKITDSALFWLRIRRKKKED